jgi:hypothetical protein
MITVTGRGVSAVPGLATAMRGGRSSDRWAPISTRVTEIAKNTISTTTGAREGGRWLLVTIGRVGERLVRRCGRSCPAEPGYPT